MPYVKLDCGIVQSTIWLEDAETVRVWIYLLTQADAVGCVHSTVPAIARDNLMGIERVREILAKFSHADPDSRDPGNNGKRIEIRRDPEWEIEILNYLKYREKDFTNAERQRAFRERQKARSNAVTRNEKLCSNGNVTLLVTQAEAEVQVQTLCISGPKAEALFAQWWAEYPSKKQKKPCAAKYIRLLRLHQTPEVLHDQIMAGLRRLKRECRKWKDGYIPNPLTFLNQERWNDEPEPIPGQTTDDFKRL